MSNQANGGGRRSSSRAGGFKGDRFIPFRGIENNFVEEFIISSEVYTKDNKQKHESTD
jgi:hypothetical protein